MKTIYAHFVFPPRSQLIAFSLRGNSVPSLTPFETTTSYVALILLCVRSWRIIIIITEKILRRISNIYIVILVTKVTGVLTFKHLKIAFTTLKKKLKFFSNYINLKIILPGIKEQMN